MANLLSTTFSGKITVGTFPNSTTNTGEAWIGRASDRNTGTLTVQLGGNSVSDRSFEVVDYGWSTVLFSVNSNNTVSVNNYLIAGNSLRAPIFYDSNDTTYYGDFASTSNLNYLNLGNTREEFPFLRMGAAGRYAIGVSGAYTRISSHNQGSGVQLGSYDGTTFTSRLTVNNDGNVEASTSLRAPIFYDSNNTTYYLDPNASTSGYFAGVLQQNVGKYVRDSHYRTVSGYGDYYSGGDAGWTRVAEIRLTGNCSGAVIFGTLYDHRYSDSDAYQISIVARADCDFTSNNESHYINVGCTIIGSTGISNYRDKVRVLLIESSPGSRKYEVQFYETGWNHNTWQLESNGWTILSSAEAPGASVGGERVNYISNQNADNLRANSATYSPIYYDSNNTAYYGDFASTSRINTIVYDDLKWSGDQTYGLIGRNGYLDTLNGRGTDPLELNYYDGGSVKIGSGIYGSKDLYASMVYVNSGNAVIHAGNIGSQSVNYASSAGNSATTSQIVFNDLKTNFPSGAGGGHSFGSNHYSMGLDVGNGGWDHPHYRDVIIGYHTGIRIGASYSGIRFYNNSPTTDANNDGNGDGGEALLMTIGGYVGTANHTDVVVNNNLFANVSMRAPIFYDSVDTGYYVDPNSNSKLVNLGLGGATPDLRLSVSGDIHMDGYIYQGGTAGVVNSWGSRTYVNSGNYVSNARSFAFNNVGYGSNWTFAISSDGAVTTSRHIDANTTWTNSATTLFLGWYGGKVVIGNNNEANHDNAAGLGGNTIAITNTLYSFEQSNLYYDGSLKLYMGSDGTRNTGWAYHTDNGTGIHWPNNGWHIYPINASDMYIRSGASDCSLKFTKNGTSGSYVHCSSDDDIGFLTTGRSWSLRVDNSGNAFATSSFRAPIFYDSNDTGYYLDPNETSNLNQISASTSARWGRSGNYWTVRPSLNSGVGYWTGTNGWGTGEGTWANAWKGGFSGWDIWGTGTDHPQGSGYVHAQGIVSGQHYVSSNGGEAYGWMMVGAADATANRYWLRGKWGTTTSGWVEMITSGNISSQSVSYASSAGNADTVDNYHASGLWRSDGGNWNPGANITLYQTGNSQEWSFDIYRQGYTGGYWHVWDSAHGTMLGVDATNNYVWATGSFRAPIFYDSNDTNYYVNPSEYSYLWRTSTHIAPSPGVGSSNWVNDFNNTPVSSMSFGGDLSSGGPSGTWWFQQNMRHGNSSSSWGTQIAWGWEDNANELRQRNVSAGSWSNWTRYINTNNFQTILNPYYFSVPAWTTGTQTNVRSSYVTSGRWYRIANLGTERFFARVRIYDDSSGGPHSSVEFQVAGAFNNPAGYSFTMTSNGYYSSPSVTEVRILSAGTYDPQYLEVYINYVGYQYSSFAITLLEARNASLVNFDEGGVPSGYSRTSWLCNAPLATGGRRAIFNDGFVAYNDVEIPTIINTNRFDLESSRAVSLFGHVGRYVSTQSAQSNYIPFSFESTYGNHSWGQITRFHIQQSGADRPSIQFSSGSNNTRWNVGYCYPDDSFRITQNMGMRPDNSGTNDGWGTERFKINTDGWVYTGAVVSDNWFRPSGATGLYFGSYGYGIYAAEAGGSSYGNVATYGDGANSWPGYAIGNLAVFMARDTRRGIFIPSADSWLIRYEQSANEAFVDFNLTWGSDIRYKSNVNTISSALDKVTALRGVTYNYKGSEKTSIGFIAQEVEQVVPEVVSTDIEGFKGVGYANMVALLTEAIKEQQTIINDLKARIELLESK